MARPLLALERFFERLLERPMARLFRAPLQPIQLQRRIERAMEGQRRLSADRTYVPNRYVVRLCAADLAAFAGYREALEVDLAAAVTANARQRGYALVERAVVILREDRWLVTGAIAVDAAFETVAAPTARGGTTGAGADGHTAVLATADLRAGRPAMSLLVREPGARTREVNLSGPARIGRAPDNDLVLADAGVSRVHARIAPQQGAWIFQDLGSSNGSFLNGHRVTEVALGRGDELRLGETRLTVGQDP
ncbi:MAG: FhaA domain-containing protein [Candidatus Limnocylindrales bacterium]